MTLLPTALAVLLHGAVSLEPSLEPPLEPPPRWFTAAEIDVGFVYFRPRLELGWGQPHTSWVGLDLNPIFSDEGVAGYAGLRLEQPLWHLRVGGRAWYTFYRSFLEPRFSYSVEDIELEVGPRSRFLTWEAELGLELPLGPGELLAEGAGSYVTNVPDGYYVYEETLRQVVEPPWAWRARGGYLWWSFAHTLRAGPVVELAGAPERGTMVLRVGGLVRITLSEALEARGTFLPPVASRDALGVRGGDTFLVGIRYRWANGP